MIVRLQGKDTLWNFCFRAFHEIQFQGHFMKDEILSWNTFTLESKFHCVCFSSLKKLCLQRYDIFWQPKFNGISFDKYLLLVKQKQTKNSKRPKCIWMKPWLKNTNDKSACVSIFSELLLTGKFQHYLQTNATSSLIFIHLLLIHLTLLTLITRG